jgi:tripartite-type tricarboxylate transporter receptor subunit TctC
LVGSGIDEDMMDFSRALSCVAATAVAITFAATSQGEASAPWPSRTVRLIVPWGAGAGDLAARVFAERLAERWKQPVIVENRPGANGLVGVAAFAALREDHTLLFSAAAPISVLPAIQEKLPYDPTRDVVPISTAADTVGVIAASAPLKLESLADLVALAKARPRGLNYYAAAGVFPILFAGFLKTAGIEMVAVSYREANPAAVDLAEGRIEVLMGIMSNVLPQVRAEKVRLLVVTNRKRVPFAPEIPTAIEAGYPGLAFEGLQGLFGPRDMPRERRDRISTDMRAVAAEPGVAARLATVAQVARGSTPAEFAAAIEEQRNQVASTMTLIAAKPAQ